MRPLPSRRPGLGLTPSRVRRLRSRRLPPA